MIALLRYKKLSALGEGRQLWGYGLFLLLALGAYGIFLVGLFVSFYLPLQGRVFPEAAANFLLFFVAVWVGNYNVNGLALSERFAREFEYLATLPVPLWMVALIELFTWLVKNLLLLGLFLLAPVLALALDGAARVPSGALALLALGLYCIWLVLFGGWLRLHALRGQGWITSGIRALTVATILLGVLVLPDQALPAPLVSLQGAILTICSWPVLPSVWTVQAAYGHWLFWFPLVGLTALTAWRTLPRLLRFWEEKAASKARRSRYPLRLLFGSGWAFAKYAGAQLLLEPATQFIARSLTLIPLLVLWLSGAQANAQVLWLLALVLISWLLGAPAYAMLLSSAEQLAAGGLPLTAGDMLRGSSAILGMIYVPALGVVACFIGFAIGWTTGLILAWIGSMAGVALLVLSAWCRVPLFWAFCGAAILGAGCSFLLLVPG